MRLTLLTPPSGELVTLNEARLQCRVDLNDEDTLLQAYIGAAVNEIETYLRRSLFTQAWRLTLDAFPSDVLRLTKPPVQSVDVIKYIDMAGVEQTLDTSTYVARLDETPGSVVPAYGQSWPSTRDQFGAVTVDFTAGYGDAANDVPAAIKAAALLIVADLYANRERHITGTIITANPAMQALLNPHRYREMV